MISSRFPRRRERSLARTKPSEVKELIENDNRKRLGLNRVEGGLRRTSAQGLSAYRYTLR